MPFPRPTLAASRAQARAFFQARLPGADMTLRRSVLGVLADLVAGKLYLAFGYLDYLATVFLPDRAPGDYLLRWGAIYGLAPEGATQSAGNAIFAGISGTDVPAGTLARANGVEFATQDDAAIGGGGTVSLAVEATAGGVAGNLPDGTPLTLVTAIPGINGTATVDTGGLTGGTDAETIDEFRANQVLPRIRTPPQGGDVADYIAWAFLVPGVTRVWVFPGNRGAGTVDVAFVMDGRANIIPLSGDVTAVQAAIDARRPVTADCVVFAPAAYPIARTIHSLVLVPGAVTATVKAAILANHVALLRTMQMQGAAIPPTPNTTYTGVVPYEMEDAAINATQGVADYFLSVPNADVTVPRGSVATAGVDTYT